MGCYIFSKCYNLLVRLIMVLLFHLIWLGSLHICTVMFLGIDLHKCINFTKNIINLDDIDYFLQEYQKARATNNKLWVYYNLFEIYLGEGGSLSLNPLVNCKCFQIVFKFRSVFIFDIKLLVYLQGKRNGSIT